MNMIVINSVFSISDLKYKDRQHNKAFKMYVSPPIPRRGRCALQKYLALWILGNLAHFFVIC